MRTRSLWCGNPTRGLAATLGLALALSLVAAACGSSEPAEQASAPTANQARASTSTPASTPEPAPENADPAPASDLPSVELVDIATGATVNLASFAPSDRPIVLWFWAPH